MQSFEELTALHRKSEMVIEGPLTPGFMQGASSTPGGSRCPARSWHRAIRLGTREIEESISSHVSVAEVAVVGVADALTDQVATAFVVLRDASLGGSPEAALKAALEPLAATARG